MKGKVYTNQYGKLSIRGEDGNFYRIGKSLSQYEEGAEVEFDVSESTYNGKEQKWANAIKGEGVAKKAAEKSPAESESAHSESSLLTIILRGIGALVNETKETNRLLGELLKKGGTGTHPVQPKAPVPEQPLKNELGNLPF